MPDELKGDRSYHEILRRAGVKNPGEVRIQNPVVMTAAVDDLSELHAPLANNMYVFAPYIGANPGQRSGCYLVSAGCWLKIAAPYNHINFWTTDPPVPVLLNLGEVIPRTLGGEASLALQKSRVYVARDVAGAWPHPTWDPEFEVDGRWFWSWLPLYLPPGRIFWMTNYVDNASMRAIFWLTELPPAPEGG